MSERSFLSRPALASWLRANAIFSLGSGVAAAAAAHLLPGLLGVGGRLLYLGLGGALVLYAVRLWVLARRDVAPVEGWAIVIGDVLWMVGSGVLIGSGAPTPSGNLIVAGVAIVIAVFAAGQGRAIVAGRRSGRMGRMGRPSGHSREAASVVATVGTAATSEGVRNPGRLPQQPR